MGLTEEFVQVGMKSETSPLLLSARSFSSKLTPDSSCLFRAQPLLMKLVSVTVL